MQTINRINRDIAIIGHSGVCDPIPFADGTQVSHPFIGERGGKGKVLQQIEADT